MLFLPALMYFSTFDDAGAIVQREVCELAQIETFTVNDTTSPGTQLSLQLRPPFLTSLQFDVIAGTEAEISLSPS